MKDITQELPAVGRGYEPLDPNNPTYIDLPELTPEQVGFIDNFAEKHDLSFQSAFNIVWRDALNELIKQVRKSEKYINVTKIQIKG